MFSFCSTVVNIVQVSATGTAYYFSKYFVLVVYFLYQGTIWMLHMLYGGCN